MSSLAMTIIIAAASVIAMVAVSFVVLRMHNSRAERIYLRSAGIERAFTETDRLVEQMAKEQMALGIISEAAASHVSGGHPWQEAVRDILELTARTLSTETPVRARVLLMQDGRLRPVANYVPPGVTPFRGSTFGVGEGAVGLAYESGKSVLIDNIMQSELFASEHSSVGPYQSVLCVPIPTVGKPIGVLNLDAPTADFFVEEHGVWLSVVCNILYMVLAAGKEFDAEAS